MTAQNSLTDAVQQGAADEVARLLAEDPTLADARHESGVSAMMLALYYQQSAIAEQIAALREAFSMRELAALGRTDELAAALALEPEALDRPASDGFRLLGLASFFGHESTVERLLELGADPILPSDNPTRVTALHSAVAFRDPEVGLANARRLLAHGAAVDAPQQSGWTALHSAAMHGNEPLVRLLLENGADSSLGNDDGKKPSDLAAEAGHDTLIALL